MPLLLLLIVAMGLTACGPMQREMVVEVGPSETAYLVSLEKDTQGKFESIEYLESQKVAAKRILLPQRQQQTGRMPGSYRWIPTARVIKVDRAPVSRKWVGDPTTNNDPKTAPLEVESIDSIGFAIGVTITARIDEKNASRFLYYFAAKPLAEVIDTNIKSFILTRLSEEFGALPLQEARRKKNDIFNRTEKEAMTFFLERGITIDYMGLSEGLTYLNPEIQEAIDASFKAEQDRITAQQEQEAQVIRNKTLIAQVTAQATAARQQAQVLPTTIAIKRAEALLTMAEKWNGQLPTNVIPSDNPFMGMFFGTTK